LGPAVVSARTVAPARVVPDEALHGLGLTVTPTGVVLGRDGAGAAVRARLLGPTPTSVTFVGGWWAAQVLVHRLLAHGATVIVDAIETESPGRHGMLAGLAQWLALGQLVGGRRVQPAGQGPLWANATQPLLLLHDTGGPPTSPDGGAQPAPWQTRLTVLTRVTPDHHDLIASSDVVLTQRLDPREAALVGSALVLPAEFTANAGALQNEMVAACKARMVRYVWLTPTTVERRIFG
jgi:hypothetical protein